MKAGTAKAADLDKLLEDIPAWSRGELIARWVQHYGSPPPKGISTRLLRYAVAYALQVEVHGGLSKTTRRELLRIARSAQEQRKAALEQCTSRSLRNTPSIRPRPALPRPGAKLVREWNGRTHVVDVTDHGFLWQGKTFRSLSRIASTITGARWSGPRFFGLT